MNSKTGINNNELFKFPRLSEVGHNFQLLPDVTAILMLFGYFQSYKYFDEYYSRS